jgi:hypothetical protein
MSAAKQAGNLLSPEVIAAANAIEAGIAFCQSDADVDDLVAPTLNIIASASLALPLPPPVPQLISAGLMTAAEGVKASVNLQNYGAKMAIKFLPISISVKTTQLLRGAPIEYWKASCKDKLAQYVKKDLPAPARAIATGILELVDFDEDVTYRFADKLAAYARSYGATDWQAAALCAAVSANTQIGADIKHLHEQYDIVSGVQGAWKTQTLQQMWQARVKQEGGVFVKAATVKNVPSKVLDNAAKPKAGGFSPLVLGAGVLALGALR